jgi:hypothetical protein
MSILHRGHSIDDSYQVSVHLANRFQRRRFKKIGQSETRLLVAAMFFNGSGQNEQTQNLVGSILGRFSIKVAHLVPIR